MRLANGLNEFYSRNFNDDEFEYFVDNEGLPTIDYPHIHIIFRKGTVFVIASQNRSDHKWHVKLTDTNDGGALHRTIQEAIKHLDW